MRSNKLKIDLESELFQGFEDYLLSHEEDIASNIDGFGGLWPIFLVVFDRMPVVAGEVTLDLDTEGMSAASKYLLHHEDDIASRVKDFGDLWPIFVSIHNRLPNKR